MRIKYKPVAHDGYRSQEQQVLLLARRARRVWRAWCRTDEYGEEVGVIGQDGKLDKAMRDLYRQIMETDVFYSGYQEGLEEEE